MWKKIAILFFAVAMSVACSASKKASPSAMEKEELKIVVASDLHYFDPSLYENCSWFEGLMLKGDGKMVTYADEILDAFQEDMRNLHPDLIVLTGDLTFNGEAISHQTLAKRWNALKEQGIAVAVLPGNHDIDSVMARGFNNENYYDVDAIDAKTFRTLYAEAGYDQAISKHEESLSYCVSLNADYNLIMLDTNAHTLTGGTMSQGGYVSESTMKWLEQTLREMKQAGKRAIVAMHHNLALHFPTFGEGYTVADNEAIATLLKQYEVPFVLSGHMHCQHIAQIQGIYDIASSSLLDAPLQYGVITLHENTMEYHTRSLQISINADDYFDFVSRQRFQDDFEAIEDETKREDMLQVAITANRYFFAGTMADHMEEVKQMKGYPYYAQAEGDKVLFYKSYLETMMKERDTYQSLTLKIK